MSFENKQVSSRLRVSKMIGKGANGEIYDAVYRGDIAPGPNGVVAKISRRHQCPQKKDEFLRKLDAIKTLSHPNICAVHAVEVLPQFYWTVFDKLDGSDVIDYVISKSPSTVSVEETRLIVFQMLRALHALHGIGLVHCDVKLDNLRFKCARQKEVALIDFDDCRSATPCIVSGNPVGTLQYLAPEVLDREHSSARDLWSVGVAMFVLLEGFFPFDVRPAQQNGKINWAVLRRALSKEPQIASWIREDHPEAADLLRQLLLKDPRKRITATEALMSRWFEDLLPEGSMPVTAPVADSTDEETPMPTDALNVTEKPRSKSRHSTRFRLPSGSKSTTSKHSFTRALTSRFRN